MKISGETTLKEVLEREGAQEILSKHDVPCVPCPFAKMEMGKLTLKDICEKYNIKIENLLKDLKKV